MPFHRPTSRQVRPFSRKPGVLIAAAALVPLPFAPPAQAANKVWIGGTANWNTPANWSPAGNPAAGDNASLFNSGTPFPVITFDGTGAPSGSLSSLTVDGTTGFTTLALAGGTLTANVVYVGMNGNGLVAVNGGNLTATGGLNVGYNPNSSGTVNQTLGTVSVNGTLLLGDDTSANGTYNQSGGTTTATLLTLGGFVSSSKGTYSLSGAASTLTLPSGAQIGGPGAGTFNQSGGGVNVGVAGSIQLGASTGGQGTYNLSGGTLNQPGQAFAVGSVSTGVMNQTGGTATLSQLIVGGTSVTATTAVGTYNLSGTASTVSSSYSEYIGSYGVGTVNQSGGVNTASGGLSLANNAGSVGNYNLSGGTLNGGNASMIVGYSGLGTFSQSAGASAFNGVALGYALNATSGPFGTGVVNLSGGTFTATQFENVGAYGVGTFNQTGGLNAAGLNINLGVSSGANGTYNLGGGTVTAGNEVLGDGAGATGAFTQTNGFNSVSNNVFVGVNGAGVYNLSGGSLSAGAVVIGANAPGTFTQSGGANTVTGQVSVSVAGGTSTASYSLANGNLTAGSVVVSPTGLFNQSGGTLFTSSFTLAGGTVTGTLQNQGTFTYSSGNFAGRLLNQGSVSLPAAGVTFGNGIENDASFTVIANQTLTLNGQGLDNLGTFTLAGGTVAGTGVQTNDIGGALNGHGLINAPLANLGTLTPDGLLQVGAAFTNGGRLALGPAATLRAAAAFANTGEVDALGGALTLNAGGTNGGVINLATGGGVNGAGSLTNAIGGTLEGAGRVSLPLLNGGIVLANGGGPLVLSNVTGNLAGAELRVADGSTLTLTTALANAGGVRLLGVNATLTGDVLTNNGTLRGAGQVSNVVVNNSVIRGENGNLQIASAGSTNTPAGQVQAATGATVTYLQGLATNAGLIALGGGTFDNNNFALANPGSIAGNGTLRTGGLLNSGSMTLSDVASAVYGPVTNTGSLKITNNTTTFYGFFNNASGTVKTTAAIARYLAGASIGGTYISDPSTQSFTDLAITPTGAIQGGAGDAFVVSGSYASASTNAANWNTQNALLHLNGGGTHGVSVTGTGGPAFTWGQFVVDPANTANLSGAGGFYAGATTNNGAVDQLSDFSYLGTLTGAGSLTVGGSNPAAVTASSFSQSAVTLNTGGLLTVPVGAARVTNTAAALNIVGGLLDLTQNNLTTQTSLSAIRADIRSAYAGGNWSGTSGIKSSFAAASPSAIGVAYVGNTSTGSVFLRPSLVGDTNLDGKVNGLDTRLIYTGGAFNDGQNTLDWSQGDMNYDGLVNGLDTRAIYTSGNFNNAAQTFATPAKLTTPAANPTLGPVTSLGGVDGRPDLEYNRANGDVMFIKDGYNETVVEILLHSDAGNLRPENFSTSIGATASAYTIDVQSGTGFTTYDFGEILPADLTYAQAAALLSAYDGNHDPTGLGPSGMYIVGDAAEHFYDVPDLLPEPTGLSLVSLAGIGLLARRRLQHR